MAVKSALGVLDFEGFEGEYPQLGVVPAAVRALDRARKSGRLSYLNRGAVVSQCCIVRERLSQLRNGELQWTYSNEIGQEYWTKRALGLTCEIRRASM